jgi:hypothetical protein
MENKITIEQAKQQISEGFSSIFSKDDVLHLLSVLETNSSLELSELAINEISEYVAESLQGEGTDLVDDYDLSMSYKEVELDSIDFSESKIKSAVQDALENYIDSKK